MTLFSSSRRYSPGGSDFHFPACRGRFSPRQSFPPMLQVRTVSCELAWSEKISIDTKKQRRFIILFEAFSHTPLQSLNVFAISSRTHCSRIVRRILGPFSLSNVYTFGHNDRVRTLSFPQSGPVHTRTPRVRSRRDGLTGGFRLGGRRRGGGA